MLAWYGDKPYLLRFNLYTLYTMLQYTIVFLLLLLAIAYAIHRIRQTFKQTKNGCYGCKGCAIREQMMKKHAKIDPKTKKFECFTKKDA